MESVCARAYNLGAAAYLLALSGLYDESSNLIRGLGEIGNLISLSVWDTALFREWIELDDKKRKQKFTPAFIRKALESKKGHLIAEQEWYSEFCERYTHITPHTAPGAHSTAGRKHAGPVY